MAWIEQVSDDAAEGQLAKIYAAAHERAGGVANIIRVMSLRPKPLGTFMNLYVQLMIGDTAVSRADKEMLATVTSQVNDCFY